MGLMSFLNDEDLMVPSCVDYTRSIYNFLLRDLSSFSSFFSPMLASYASKVLIFFVLCLAEIISLMISSTRFYFLFSSVFLSFCSDGLIYSFYSWVRAHLNSWLSLRLMILFICY